MEVIKTLADKLGKKKVILDRLGIARDFCDVIGAISASVSGVRIFIFIQNCMYSCALASPSCFCCFCNIQAGH